MQPPVVVCSAYQNYAKFRAWEVSVDNVGGDRELVWGREHLAGFCPILRVVSWTDSAIALSAIEARKGFWGSAYDVLAGQSSTALVAAGVASGSPVAAIVGGVLVVGMQIKGALEKQNVPLNPTSICPSQGMKIAPNGTGLCFLLELK